MSSELFDAVHIAGVYVSIVVLILFFFEIGFQIGIHIRMRPDSNASTTVGPMVGGLLAMLAFLLAFTFSMAAAENTLRKGYVLDEANAIGTAYLRADLLEEQYKTEVKHLLKEYVDIRLKAVISHKISMKEAITRSVEIHKLLWVQVSAAALRTPGVNASLAVQSINEVIDMHEKRLSAGFYNRIPSVIWLALLAILCLTMVTMGVQAGFSRLRILVAVIPLVLAFSALTTVIVDLDRPYRSLIDVGQASMIDLQNDMAEDIK